jgi:hypothetical protein
MLFLLPLTLLLLELLLALLVAAVGDFLGVVFIPRTLPNVGFTASTSLCVRAAVFWNKRTIRLF